MTDRFALTLALTLVAVAAANFAFGWGLHIVMGRVLAETVGWLAFWR